MASDKSALYSCYDGGHIPMNENESSYFIYPISLIALGVIAFVPLCAPSPPPHDTFTVTLLSSNVCIACL